jgi:hypothetical protein
LQLKLTQLFLELRNLLLLDPRGDILVPCPDGIPRLLSPGNSNLDHWRRYHHPLNRSTFPRGFPGDVHIAAGIFPREMDSMGSNVVLSDLRASTLLNGRGPFKLKLTNDPFMHLQFEENEAVRPILYVLDTPTIFRLSMLDVTGILK